ncbi:hypothetical protein ASF72_10640 [Arthrobacter sp. Leaf141]|uniref:DUF3168 domain-containing protein n=1 Tax=Arthrobacter sp. Leaf141 TaxID=1736273 RepID=UPI0006F3B3AB|nr:DUF3168 domain-containing protein [Arthrobacter sp. Leaf141]KQR02483.1 hypothetical protein ASF72_10640 [Arthrobacter sp. Leaf141]
MAEEHYKALEARLRAVAQAVLDGPAVHFGAITGTPESADYPYILIGGNAGQETSAAPVASTDTLELRFKLTYAGLSFESVLFIVSLTRRALIGARLQIPGWTCAPLRHEALQDIRTDFDVIIPDIGSPLFAVDELVLFAGR